ncbi:F-box/LRR-repeat protein 6-like [Tropilaelaps mercedesae]|uniref:F-box/LRR-repeat protein 6-like n=1 Tax=Tropilaelaps mercedesae TaxID=418985 RepID=A0A1V9XD73_9ACAR|nr:F-box/LRR-repeat protein 6-like [Tropilaelaps mercedesae]
MPILFSFLSNHRDFPSDSESDDPDFVEPTKRAAQAVSSDDSSESSSSFDHCTDLATPAISKPCRKPGEQLLSTMDKEASNESDKASPASIDNGAASSACSPVLARSPDTTTATPMAGDVEEDEEDEDEDNRAQSHSPGEQNDPETETPRVNKISPTQAPPPVQLPKKPQAKLQLVLPKKRKRAKKDKDEKVKKRGRRKKSIMVAENVEGSNSLKLVFKKKPEVTDPVYDGPPPCAPGLWNRQIPREVLLKIFRHGVEKFGVLPFLITAREVCPEWRAVAEDVSLWEKVDMSIVKVKEAQLTRWATMGMLKRVRELNLSNFGPNITHSTITSVINHCPRLEILNLSYNTKLSTDTVEHIVNKCDRLRGLDISGTTKNRGGGPGSTCSPSALKSLIIKRGENLVQLCLAENAVSSLNSILNLVPSYLSRLQMLDLSNITMTSCVIFPLERIQEKCPDLKVLRLANTQVRLAAVPPAEQARSPGFPLLEELSVANLFDLGDSSLMRFLKSSEKLTLLDVRSCKSLSVSGLIKIPAWDLTQLYLANCDAATNPDVELVMNKWAHSLKVIDVSWVSNDTAINAALRALATHSDTPSNVYELDLKGSSVSFSTLKIVLDRCQRLRKLNLTSCRSLPRGIKRVYEDTAVADLRAQALAGKFDEDD